MNIANSPAALAGDRDIVATRILNAPRELVFKAWTDPEHIGQWWGPNGFSITLHEMDVRPGGDWRFIMHGPDGRDYDNHNVYVEVVPPERLVFDHVSPPRHRMTAIFAEQGDKTRLDIRMEFESGSLRDHVAREYGAVKGLDQTLSRFEEYLANE